jgi:hypothetical protein
MFRFAQIPVLLFPMLAMLAGAQVHVQVDSTSTVPRPLETQTEKGAVQDYIQSWQVMHSAFSQNRADLLNSTFVGNAEDTLSASVKEQSALAIQTSYQDISHNIQFIFYSPEGLSIEFTDSVKYNVQVFDHGRLIATHQERARYLVVMSPAETRWKVRIFQAI